MLVIFVSAGNSFSIISTHNEGNLDRSKPLRDIRTKGCGCVSR